MKFEVWKAVAAALCALLASVALPATAQTSSTPAPGAIAVTAEVTLTFHLVPVRYWDDPEGPVGHELPEGRIFLFRNGSFEAEIVATAEEPFALPDGEWSWMAEAPGYVSTSTDRIFSLPPGKGPPRRELTVPVVAACHVTRADDERWQRLDRVDVVSLTESAVYPQLPAGRSEFWIPAGTYLAYGVRGGELAGFTPIGQCSPEEEVNLPVPEPPDAGEESLLVTAELPKSDEELDRDEILAVLDATRSGANFGPTAPTASLWQGDRVAYFFLDVPTEGRARELVVRHPDLRTEESVVEGIGGSAREIDLGTLHPRRAVEVSVDYQPKRPHGSAEISIQPCGRNLASLPTPLLAARCDEPLETKPLEPGLVIYRFSSLDDGQYVISARIDDEEIPGLGHDVMPYLDPDEDVAPQPIGPAELEELEVHGHLLRDDEAVPGLVRISPWPGIAGIPSRSVETDDDLVYHLFYFGRYPTAREIPTFPEELQDEAPSDLPGLYCCFRMVACSDAGACRTFNEHSVFTGDGEFEIELPGDEQVDIQVIDAALGFPIEDARVLVDASPAFHFNFGDVIWNKALGAEPDVLEADTNGRATWLPPSPGRKWMTVWAPGFQRASKQVEVPTGGRVEVTFGLEPDRAVQGTRITVDDEPVMRTSLVAFDREGARRPKCDAPVNSEGYVEVPEGCQRELTYLLVYPSAALQTFAAEEIAGSGEVRARRRPEFPPKVRLVDPDGGPVAQAFVALRLGDLTISPDDLYAGARGGLPFQPTTNADGEVVLQGVDVDTVEQVEVSPWRPYEEHWVTLRSRQRGVVDIAAVLEQAGR